MAPGCAPSCTTRRRRPHRWGTQWCGGSSFSTHSRDTRYMWQGHDARDAPHTHTHTHTHTTAYTKNNLRSRSERETIVGVDRQSSAAAKKCKSQRNSPPPPSPRGPRHHTCTPIAMFHFDLLRWCAFCGVHWARGGGVGAVKFLTSIFAAVALMACQQLEQA